MRNFFNRSKATNVDSEPALEASSPVVSESAAGELLAASMDVGEATSEITDEVAAPDPEFPDTQISIGQLVPEATAPEATALEATALEATAPIDFDDEFALPEIAAENEAIPHLGSGELEELEEWSEPLQLSETVALEPQSLLEAPDGKITVEERIETRGAENVYRAAWQDSAHSLDIASDRPLENLLAVRLREASGEAGERLAREAMWRSHWDTTGRIAMLPRLVTHFKTADATYLVTEMPASGATLGQLFASEEAKTAEERSDAATATFLSETLLTLAQLAAFLVRLHGAGFAHLGLRPDLVIPGKPVQILDCSFAAPIGEPLEAPLSFAGYSAPELSRPGNVDARSDIYAIGALLYRAVSGADVSESGADFSMWQPRIVMAGVPQLLRRCLGETETRFRSAEELHRALVKLKNRLRPALSYGIAGLSTIGLEPSRSTNQDAFGFLSGAWETENGPTTWAAFCVADGMGGMAAGEVASEVAVNAFLRAASLWCADAATLNQAPPTAATQSQLVKDWAALANEAVVKTLDARGVRGGCTLDAGFVIDRHLSIAHVGDSRLYLLRGGEFELLSRDHSYVMSLLLQGEISFEALRTHPDRNKVTRSLGERHPQPDYFVDSLQVTKNAPTLELLPGDVLLACSDGLWEPVLEAEMIAAVADGDLQSAAREMLKLALQRGAPDNATVVLLRLDEGTTPVFA